MDFTLKKYNKLINALHVKDYTFQSFHDILKNSEEKYIILRHDIDLCPKNSLKFAKIQTKMGIHGSYYFRAVPESWDEEIIKEIPSLGHEVGYHYESLTTCEGDIEKGIKDFEKNLSELRGLTDIKTICMHGSPKSPYDSKDLWKHVNYRDFGIIGEPYFDVNFNEVFYLTDTGRRWDGYKVSLRDRIEGHQERWEKEGLVFHSTDDIIKAVKENRLPNKIMTTFHPQRWNDRFLPWLKELLVQNVKNIVKGYIIRKRLRRKLRINIF